MKRKKKAAKKAWWAACGGITVIVVALLAWVIYGHSTKPTSLRDISVVTVGIHYCNNQDPARTLEYFRPTNAGSDKLPVVIYIHGGGWRRGDEDSPLLNNYGTEFIKKGIGVVAIDYRLTPKNPYPDQNRDIACALAFLHTNADKYNINIRKTIFFGDSAGGQLAAFAALNIPYDGYDYEAPVGVIDFYGVSDFSKIIDGLHPDMNARYYLGSNYNKVATDASPITYVTKKAPPFLFIHGTKDTIVPITQSQLLYSRLTKYGIDAEYITIQGAGHGFVGPELTSVEYKKIQDNMNAFLKETIGK